MYHSKRMTTPQNMINHVTWLNFLFLCNPSYGTFFHVKCKLKNNISFKSVGGVVSSSSPNNRREHAH